VESLIKVHAFEKNRAEQSIRWQRMHVKTKECIWLLATRTSKATPADFKDLCYIHTQDVHEYTYFNYSSTTTQCATTTHHPAAQALRQPRRAPRVLVSRPQRLYVDYAVRHSDIVFWAYDYLD
jgi:hypothetical protein